MNKYIIRRLLLVFPTLFLLSLLIFGLLRILPGDVADMLLADEGGSGASKATANALRHQLGVDRPLYIQYTSWVWDLVRGDLGTSLADRSSIGKQLLVRLPITLQIALMAQVLGMAIGIPIGILSAMKQNTFLDYTLRFCSIVLLAAPTFWVALLLILAGAIWFHWSPPIGYNPIWEGPKDNLLQVIWPVLILASHGMASDARITRSSMLEVLREDYVRTARAKGLRERVVIYRHALKNALIPVITLSGLGFAGLLGGTVIMELIFSIPGMGSWLVTSIRIHDYTVVQSLIVVLATFFMLVNLAIDLLYGWLDPRISYA